MKQLLTSSLRCCRKCGRQLPCEAFYYVKQAHRLDSHCKECRILSGRLRRKQLSLPVADEGSAASGRLSIPLVEDRARRIALIRRAKRIVGERIRLKRNRMLEEEYIVSCLLDGIPVDDASVAARS